MAGKNQYTAKEFIEAIPGSGGIINTIAKRVGCTWHTAKKYIMDYVTIHEAYQDECERVNDTAESVIIQSIEHGDVGSAMWWISRKRRDKFASRQEITGADGGPVVVVRWDDESNS